MIELGSLVQSQKNNLGIGKVTEISQPDVIVEYFCSGGQRVEKTLPLDSLSQVRLAPQTRCYISSPHQNTWLIGRISTWDEDTEMYQIDLPDKKTVFATEEEIYVRCHIPITDPMDTLAMKGHETPYFHDRRLTFVKSLIEQRAVSHGMTGLMSANIELYPHQVEVVRRVLEDPIQRYLLADEVGLGKTIEAGAILRQFLLDEPRKGAVVLVPQYLLPQWRSELENKFYISHFGKRVVVLALEDIHRINQKANIGCLIIDEAHHIAAMATSMDAALRQRFDSCKNLAHKSDRLLLLSTMPVLNHEQDFLSMLHLLDPVTYKVYELPEFRAKVQKCQEIGKFLLAFRPGADVNVLKTHLQQLRNLFAEDEYVMNLANDLENSFSAKTSNQDEIIISLRAHISETYRLHPRILRNRRAAVEDVIFDRDVTPKEEYDLDERSLDVHELIEKWRTLAPQEQAYQQIFLLFFLAAGTWLGILDQVITARLTGKLQARLLPEFPENQLRILTTTPKFPGEEEILQSCVKILRQPLEEGERTENLTTVLLNQLAAYFKLPPSIRRNKAELISRIQHRIRRPMPGDVLPKIVIFSSFKQSCQAIVKNLSQSFGAEAIASHQFGEPREKVAQNFTRFQTDDKCFILVCDRSGEEGLNLQFTDSFIHFDLPWSPNQLEQRIGRFDRIGSKIGIQSYAFLGPYLEDSPHNAWYQLLKNGFGIFEQSIASLQFYVDEKLAELETTLFQGGAAGLLSMISPIQEQITAETLKISEQTALDEIDILDENTNQYFQALDDYDANHVQIKQAIEGWMCDALGFKSVTNPNSPEIKRYQPTTRTLVSVDELQTHFANNNPDQFGTYNRRIANQNYGVKLYRMGEGLIEAINSYINWDDRGKTFAVWRTDKSWDAIKGQEWFGFRFNYVVETNLEAVQEVLTSYKLDNSQYHTLKRRVDGLFSPMLKTIFIDGRHDAMTLVTDPTLLEILQKPYKDRSSDKSRDYNLAKDRLKIIDGFVDASHWKTFCHQARQTSTELLWQDSEFTELHKQYAQLAEQKLNKKVEQLQLRLKSQKDDSALAEELEIKTALSAAIIQGINQPQMRLDSVGFIILSGRNPG